MSLLTNLVSYWKLDESSGNAADSVGSNTLTNSGVTYSAGKINNGANFNSSTLTGGSSVLNAANPFSFSFWMKSSQSGTNRTMIGFSSTNFEIDLSNVNALYADFAGGGGGIGGGTAINTGSFVYCAVTYDGTNLRLYVNGALNGTGGNYTNANTGTITLGTGFYTGFVGSLDEIGAWSRALSLSEIQQLYNGGAGLPLSSFASSSGNFLNFF